jgi:hypothetical protein
MRVQRIGFAVLVDGIVKESAKLSPGEVNRGIGHGLNEPLQTELRGEGRAGAVEHLQRARLFAKLGNTGFQSFVERQELRLEPLRSLIS